jgi:hypothetical protein
MMRLPAGRKRPSSVEAKTHRRQRKRADRSYFPDPVPNERWCLLWSRRSPTNAVNAVLAERYDTNEILGLPVGWTPEGFHPSANPDACTGFDVAVVAVPTPLRDACPTWPTSRRPAERCPVTCAQARR